jgi:hypothetical protein
MCLVLLPLAARADGALEVGGEVALFADGPGGDVRATPHIAFGKGVYLAVWREGWTGEGGAARIMASRLDAAGKVLDAKGIEVAPSKDGFQELPRIAFGGGVFLVVWQDFRSGKDLDIYGVRVSPEGKVLDASPIAVVVAPRTQCNPDVASDGDGFLVAWQGVQGDETAYRAWAAHVGPDGKAAGPQEITSDKRAGASRPRLAWDGRFYSAVYGGSGIVHCRLAPDGRLDKQRAVLRQFYPSAGYAVCAAPGQGTLVVCDRSQPDYWGWGGPGAAICYHIGADGSRDADTPKEDYPQSRLANWLDFGRDAKEGNPWPYGPPAVAWDGRQFVAVWQRQHIRKSVSFVNCDLLASRVSGWRPLDEAGVPVAVTELEETQPALASDGAGGLVCVYERHAKDGKTAIAARLLRTRGE